MNSALEKPHQDVSGIFSERYCTNPADSRTKPFPNPSLCPPPLLPPNSKVPSCSVSGLPEGGAMRQSRPRDGIKWKNPQGGRHGIVYFSFPEFLSRLPAPTHCYLRAILHTRENHFWWFILRCNSDAIKFGFKMYSMGTFHTFRRLGGHPHSLIPELFHHPQNKPLSFGPSSQSSHSLQPLATRNLLSISWICLVWTRPISGMVQHASFGVWLLSLGIKLFRFLHVVTQIHAHSFYN